MISYHFHSAAVKTPPPPSLREITVPAPTRLKGANNTGCVFRAVEPSSPTDQGIAGVSEDRLTNHIPPDPEECPAAGSHARPAFCFNFPFLNIKKITLEGS